MNLQRLLYLSLILLLISIQTASAATPIQQCSTNIVGSISATPLGSQPGDSYAALDAIILDDGVRKYVQSNRDLLKLCTTPIRVLWEYECKERKLYQYYCPEICFTSNNPSECLAKVQEDLAAVSFVGFALKNPSIQTVKGRDGYLPQFLADARRTLKCPNNPNQCEITDLGEIIQKSCPPPTDSELEKEDAKISHREMLLAAVSRFVSVFMQNRQPIRLAEENTPQAPTITAVEPPLKPCGDVSVPPPKIELPPSPQPPSGDIGGGGTGNGIPNPLPGGGGEIPSLPGGGDGTGGTGGGGDSDFFTPKPPTTPPPPPDQTDPLPQPDPQPQPNPIHSDPLPPATPEQPTPPAPEPEERIPDITVPERKPSWQRSDDLLGYQQTPQPPSVDTPTSPLQNPFQALFGAFYQPAINQTQQTNATQTQPTLALWDRFLRNAGVTEDLNEEGAIVSPEEETPHAQPDPLLEFIRRQEAEIRRLDAELQKERTAASELPIIKTQPTGVTLTPSKTEQEVDVKQWLAEILKDTEKLNQRIKAIIDKSGYYGYVQTDRAVEVYEKTGEKLLTVTTDENGRTQVGLVNKDGKVVFAPKGGVLENPAAWSEFTDAFVYIAGREPKAAVQGSRETFTLYPFEIALRELYGPEVLEQGIPLDPENPFMTIGRDGIRIPLSVFEAAQLAAEEARGIRLQKQEIAEMTGETISIITTSETLQAAKIDPALLPQMRIPTISQEARYLAELKKELAKRGHIRLTERFKVALFNRYDTTLKKVSGLVAFTIRIDENGNPITNETKTGFAIADVISSIFAEAATALTDTSAEESPLVRFLKLFIAPPRPEDAGGVIRLSNPDALPATEPRSASEALLRILTAPLRFIAQLLGR